MAEVKMDPLPGSNANSVKKAPVIEEKKEVIAKGAIKKKTFGEKCKEIFIGEDISSVGEYILTDVVVPTIKNTIVDIIQNGISLLIFGESSRNTNRRNGSYVSYGSYSSNSRDRRRDDRRSSRYDDYDDKGIIEFDDYSDANAVLDHLRDVIDNYGSVTVANYYEKVQDVIGLRIPKTYQDEKWGWRNLRYVDIRKSGRRWYIDLPRVEYID